MHPRLLGRRDGAIAGGPRMGVADIFSKRKARATAGAPDVYEYDKIPAKLRAQAVHIVNDIFGKPDPYHPESERIFGEIHAALCREYGQFRLVEDDYGRQDRRDVVLRFMMQAETEQVLDVIELALVAGRRFYDIGHQHFVHADWHPDQAESELNFRFREAAVGYEFSDGKAIRIESQALHHEVVRPALTLLAGRGYETANEEFLKAHEHYRHDRYPDAVAGCVKALESVLKAICHKRKWKVDPHATAKPLLDAVFAHGLVPEFAQGHLGNLRAALESGVPTIGNRTARHGPAPNQAPVSPNIVRYAINQAAAAIVFLVEAEKALP